MQNQIEAPVGWFDLLVISFKKSCVLMFFCVLRWKLICYKKAVGIHNFFAKIQNLRNVAKKHFDITEAKYLHERSEQWLETDFSQFVWQFMLNWNFAKQHARLFARVISKIASFPSLQNVNYLSDCTLDMSDML